jgi:hypothetical protein
MAGGEVRSGLEQYTLDLILVSTNFGRAVSSGVSFSLRMRGPATIEQRYVGLALFGKLLKLNCLPSHSVKRLAQ